MGIYLKSFIVGVLGCVSSMSHASKLNLCVFDLMGANGDIMSVAKDYALAAKEWGVEITPKVYMNANAAIRDFDSQKCDGIVADNFSTKKYNKFMGTIGAVGAIDNYDLAQKVLMAVSSNKLANKMKNQKYEVVGYMPYGLTYLHTKNREYKSISDLQNKKLAILDVDISQRRMAQKVGMSPVNSTVDNATEKFRNNEVDVLPAPLVAYEPLEIGKILGSEGGIVNYPLALFTMNFIISNDKYPTDFGQKSRQWFSQKTPQMIRTVKKWEASVPRQMIYEIPEMDHITYDRLLSQLRKEFIDTQVYDPAMITLMRHLRCAQDTKFIECKK